MKKPIYLISCFTILSALALMGTFFFWMFCPYKIIEFRTEPHTVIEKTVKAGSHIVFDLDYCKYVDMGGEVTISFVDGFIYNTTPIPSNIEKGCHNVKHAVYVPKAIPPGDYSVKILYRYKVNPVRTIDVITKSDKFTVTK